MVSGSAEDEMGLIIFYRLNPFWSRLETTTTNPDNSACGQNNKLVRKKHFSFKFSAEGKKFCHYDKAFTPVKDLSARKPLF
jgi:hypothetical protein